MARLAAVSQPVVSYVLSGDDQAPVAPATRQRVLDAIAELGYVPDHTARSLRSRRTFTIAGAIPDITNPFYPAFERGIQDVASAAGYDLLVFNTDGAREMEQKFLASARSGRVDGIIVRFFQVSLHDCLPLVRGGVPVVALTSEPPPPGDAPIDTVAIDGAAAAKAATAYLIGKGHRRIAMLAGEPGSRANMRRTLGYEEALREAGLALDTDQVRTSDFTEGGGFAATSELLNLPERPTAIFATNDLLALGALSSLKQAGLRVPDDVAIVGFDNQEIIAAHLHPGLTTVELPHYAMGKWAVEYLLAHLGEEYPLPPVQHMIGCPLVERASA